MDDSDRADEWNEVLADMLATSRAAASVPTRVWEHFGETVLGLPKHPDESHDDYLAILLAELSLRD